MGKGGKGKAKQAKPVDDDALLDAAIAEVANERLKLEAESAQNAKATKEQKAAAQKAQKAVAKEAQAAKGAATAGTVLSMPDTLSKLDRVMAFTITQVRGDGSKDSYKSPNGAVTFYMDSADAKADFEALKAADPKAPISLDFAPLGRAFALTQGLMGLKTPGPCVIQFSRAIVKQYGEAGVPPELQERMRSTGPFPLFYSDKLGSAEFTPIFFAPKDLFDFWVSCGGSPEKLPEPTVTDLRVVVARTLNEPGEWQPLHYVPHSTSEALQTELMARNKREEGLKQGFTAGAELLKKVQHAVRVEEGDEPPALQ